MPIARFGEVTISKLSGKERLVPVTELSLTKTTPEKAKGRALYRGTPFREC